MIQMRRSAIPFVVLALGVGAGLGVGGCGGAKTGSGGQVTVTVTAAADTGEATDTASSELDTAPSADETVTEEEPTNQPTGDSHTVGQTAEDDGVIFTVKSLREVQSLPVGQYSSGGPIRPAKGAKLVEAVVTWKNDTNEGLDNFCGSSGAILLDERDRNFDPIDRQIDIKGNNICSSDVQPGFKQTAHLAFQLPKDSEIAGLALWNSNSEEDYLGDTYVLFVP